jgi:DNA-binding SARP family transcriptional activator/tetratricopeptide (TPR) repeat protein
MVGEKTGVSEQSVESRILGPLELTVGSVRLGLGGTRQRIVLATLLLGANRVVTLDRLMDAMYGEDLPPTARLQAQISVHSLRRLFAAHCDTEIIVTHPGGYAMRVGAGELDSLRFSQLVAAAREAGQPEQAVARYRDALLLWRGPALDGMNSRLLRDAALALDEQRIAAIEDRITLELDLGRHHELVGELSQLVREHPLRERLQGQLMLALYRCDRAAEALRAYRDARRLMIGQLGMEPGERLRRLEHDILAAARSLDLPSGPAQGAGPRRQVPGMLPADIADFAGREAELDQIRQHLSTPAGPRFAVPVVVIAGRGGVGKTRLAVHASYGLAGKFSDGQLFADLHGGGPRPVDPANVLERFLRALGVPGSQLPEGLDERAEMFRGMLAGRSVLVVLDDAANETQISPLLPGSQTAAVMITSRSRLAGLDGASRVELGVFDVAGSVDLLARIAGPERVRSEPAHAAAVARQCGHLPLALRIAGAKLAARPHWTMVQLASRLDDETRRLDELKHGDMAVRPSISLSYESISVDAQRLFRFLALLDQPLLSVWIAAALLDQPPEHAENLLDELVTTHLIETVASQYRFHDLIRVFARERLLSEDPPAARAAAVERALGALLHLADQAHIRCNGGVHDRLLNDARRWPLPERLTQRLVSDPLSWYETERPALVAGVQQAARENMTELCWALAFAAVPLFETRAYTDDWRETGKIALAAARKAADARGMAAMLYSLACLHQSQQRFGRARRELTVAARLFRRSGDHHGHALAIHHIATLDRLNGQLDDASPRLAQALETFRTVADDVSAASVLTTMALVELERDNPAAAQELLAQSLSLSRGTGIRRVEAQALCWMGEILLMAGKPGDASERFTEALRLVRAAGDPFGEAYALTGLGIAGIRQGELGPAGEALHRAVRLAEEAGNRLIQTRALRGLSELALASGDPMQAIAQARQAVRVSRDIGTPLEHARALHALSDAHAAAGQAEEARAAAAEATAVRAEHTPRPSRDAQRHSPPTPPLSSRCRPAQRSHAI